MYGKAVESGALVKPSNPLVRLLATGWLETMCLWKEMAYQGLPKGGEMATLTMEDFTRKVGCQRNMLCPRVKAHPLEISRQAPLFHSLSSHTFRRF